jgi:SAM-dependent methyltransferase
MPADPARLAVLDRLYQDYLRDHPGMDGAWLLSQVVLSGPERRALLQMLRFEPGANVLDHGTGFGAVALELAALAPVRVVGVDVDGPALAVAAELASVLQDRGFFEDGASVEFRTGDVYELPFPDASFDAAVSRLVYQHLVDPERASAELRRVLRPGGFACVVDVDDQLSIAYPEPTDAFSRLQKAFAALQAEDGGDRYVGRKLAGYLDDAGFEVAYTLVLPQSRYAPPAEVDAVSRAFTASRIREARAEIVARGIMEEVELDECLALYEREGALPQFQASGQIAVIARVPAG